MLWSTAGAPSTGGAIAPGLAGLWLLLNAATFVHTTRAGKFAVWAELLDELTLTGGERLLDVPGGHEQHRTATAAHRDPLVAATKPHLA